MKLKTIVMKYITPIIIIMFLACFTFESACGGNSDMIDNLNENNWYENNLEKPFRVLAIGNSFSVDAMEYVLHIAKSAGLKHIELGNLYIGGCSLEKHLWNLEDDSAFYEYYRSYYHEGDKAQLEWKVEKNVSIKTAIKEIDWDFITMQQSSGLSGIANTYNDLEEVIKYLNQIKSENTKLAWHMTWAYQSNSNHVDFKNYSFNQLEMYNAIVSAVKNKVSNNSNVEYIIPSGTSIQNLRTSFMGDNLTRDGYHLNLIYGRYTAGLTYFYALTGLPLESVTYEASIDSELIKAIKKSVNDACLKPFEISSFSK